MRRILGSLTYANVMATLAVFLVLGGGAAIAAGGLGKNSVGAKQLKRNAVTAAKIKRGAVTGAKIRLATLGTVPKAQSAQTAESALTAQRADAAQAAQFAQQAGTLSPPEPWHQVGAPGEPAFEHGWGNVPYNEGRGQSAAFFKDHEGIVHLRGFINGGTNETSAFRLPVGYRPEPGHYLYLLVSCDCFGDPYGLLLLSGTQDNGGGGGVEAPGKYVSLAGITYRAES